jgi:carbon storage regulator
LLVLSRHRDEEILIGDPGPDQITIVVVDIRGDKVRLGVKAPKDMPVHRKEVADAIARNGDAGYSPRQRAQKRRDQAAQLLREAEQLERRAGG